MHEHTLYLLIPVLPCGFYMLKSPVQLARKKFSRIVMILVTKAKKAWFLISQNKNLLSFLWWIPVLNKKEYVYGKIQYFQHKSILKYAYCILENNTSFYSDFLSTFHYSHHTAYKFFILQYS